MPRKSVIAQEMQLGGLLCLVFLGGTRTGLVCTRKSTVPQIGKADLCAEQALDTNVKKTYSRQRGEAAAVSMEFNHSNVPVVPVALPLLV